MRIEMANDAMLNFIWRKKREDVLGKNLLEAFPELVSQKYPDLLKEVMIQNRIQSERESKAIVTGDDGEREFWVDYNYHPLPNAQGVAAVSYTHLDVYKRQADYPTGGGGSTGFGASFWRFVCRSTCFCACRGSGGRSQTCNC